MKKIDSKENKIVFTAEIEESLANAIRRYVNHVPIFAIDEIEISKNDSSLYDETIAQRMAFIPLKMSGSAKGEKTAEFKLSSAKEGFVKSKEMKGDLKVVYGEIPITFLNKDQELEMKAFARIGRGYEHSKFSPGFMFYRNLFEIKIDKDCPSEVVSSCPVNILKLENGKVVAKNPEKCDFCEACIDFCDKKGKESIKITPEKELLITVESFGQIDSDDIFKKAIEELEKDLEDVAKKISKE